MFKQPSNMIRQTLIQTIKPTIRTPISIYRTITSTALRMAEGDVGSVRSGGAAQGSVPPSIPAFTILCTDIELCVRRDAFSKREEASENFYVREKEMEKWVALRCSD